MPTLAVASKYLVAGAIVGAAASWFWCCRRCAVAGAARNALHDIDEELANRGFAKQPGKLTKKYGYDIIIANFFLCTGVV